MRATLGAALVAGLLAGSALAAPRPSGELERKRCKLVQDIGDCRRSLPKTPEARRAGPALERLERGARELDVDSERAPERLGELRDALSGWQGVAAGKLRPKLRGREGRPRSSLQAGLGAAVREGLSPGVQVPLSARPLGAGRRGPPASAGGLDVDVLASKLIGKKGQVSEAQKRAAIRMAIAKSGKYGVDPLFTLAITQHESYFKVAGCSSAGACGPMQVMPSTAGMSAARLQTLDGGFEAGVKYLKYLSGLYGGRLGRMAEAYNAGPAGDPTNPETVAFKSKVMATYRSLRAASGR